MLTYVAGVVVERFYGLRYRVIFQEVGVVDFSVVVRGRDRVAKRLSSFRVSFRGRSLFGYVVPFQDPPFFVF